MPKSRKKREVSKLAFIVTSLFHHYCDIVWNTVGVYLFAEFSSLVGNGVRGLFFLLFWFRGQEVSPWAGLWLTLSFMRNSVIACWRFVHTPQDGTLPWFSPPPPTPLFFICLHIFVLLSFWIVFWFVFSADNHFFACYWFLHLFELSWPWRHIHIHKTTRTKKQLSSFRQESRPFGALAIILQHIDLF